MTQFERFYCVIKKPWIIASYALIVYFIYSFSDKSIAIYFHQLDLRSYAHILNAITTLGKWSIYIILFALLGLFFRYIKKNELFEQRAWFLLACVLLTNMVGIVLKITLSRSRPDLYFADNYFGFYWFKFNDLFWSFPSGHSITIAGLAAGLGVIFPRYFYAFLGVALLVISTRVFLYFHYLSDVMTGFYLSILVVGLFTENLKKRHCLAEII
jgi:membrane-associated phospholipid phosphatase